MQKLIFLNGFAGCGKSTIARLYRDDHPLTLSLEGDEIITMLGHWQSNWDEAVQAKLALSEVMVRTHLARGYSVMLPFLLTDPKHAESYEHIAQEYGAAFYEIYLEVEREDAIARLLKRGSWGEAGSPPFTDKDLLEIEDLFDRMINATKARNSAQVLHPNYGKIEETYAALLKLVGE